MDMDEDEAQDAELELLGNELRDLSRRNMKKAIATNMPPLIAMDLRVDILLAQLYPEPIDRLRFELHYEEQLRAKLQGWEIAMRDAQKNGQAPHPSQQLFRPGGGSGHA